MKRFGRLINMVASPIGLMLLLSSFAAHGQDTKSGNGGTGNVIQSIDVSMQAGTITVRLGLKDALPNPPAAFTVNNPPRVALDFPNTAKIGRAHV